MTITGQSCPSMDLTRAEVIPLVAPFANSLRCNGASAAEGRPAVIGMTA